MKRFYIFSTILPFLLFLATSGIAATFESDLNGGSGNWNDATTWERIQGADSDGIPDGNDEVRIINGEEVTIQSGTNASAYRIFVAVSSSAQTSLFRINGTLSVTNKMTLNPGRFGATGGTVFCVVKNQGALLHLDNANLEMDGPSGSTNNDVQLFIEDQGVVELEGKTINLFKGSISSSNESLLRYTGANNVGMPIGSNTNYFNLEINKTNSSDQVSINGDITSSEVEGTIVVKNGILQANGSVTTNDSLRVEPGGSISSDGSGNLTIGSGLVFDLQGGSFPAFNNVSFGADAIMRYGGASNLTVDASVDYPATLYIAGGGTKTLDGAYKASVGDSIVIQDGATFDMGGNSVTLPSTSGGHARLGTVNGSVSGNFIVKRWISSGTAGWGDIGAPISGTTVADIDDDIYVSGKVNEFDGCATSTQGGCFWSIKKDDGAGGWQDVTSSGTSMNVGEGFEVYFGDEGGTASMSSDTTMDFTGPPNTGSLNIGTDNAFTLISNPYPSPIDLSSLGVTAWAASASADDFVSINTAAPGQGFWVDNGGNDVNFTESMKISSASFQRMRSNKKEPSVFQLEMKNPNSNKISSAMMDFRYGATDQADGKDLGRPLIPSDAKFLQIQTLSTDQKPLRLNTLDKMDSEKSVPVIISTPSKGTFEISAKGLDHAGDYTCAKVEDLKTGQVFDLNQTSTFTFRTEEVLTDQHRFNLILKEEACRQSVGMEEGLDRGESIEITQDVDGANVHFNFNEQRKVTMALHDMTGKKVMDNQELRTMNSTERIESKNLSGIYIIAITTAESRITRKVQFH